MLIRFFVLCFLIMTSGILNSQISLGGGLNSIAAFGIKKPYLGLNFIGEYKQDEMSYFAKFYTTLPQDDADIFISMDPINQNDSLMLDLNGKLTYRYNVLEFGKKYYFGKDLDFGPSSYFSSHFAFLMNTVNIKTDKFDPNRYKFPTGFIDKGKIFAVAVGLNAGAQYSFYYGTYFADIGLNYIITGLPNNEVASAATTVKQLFFVFNIGFKKTIFQDY